MGVSPKSFSNSNNLATQKTFGVGIRAVATQKSKAKPSYFWVSSNNALLPHAKHSVNSIVFHKFERNKIKQKNSQNVKQNRTSWHCHQKFRNIR